MSTLLYSLGRWSYRHGWRVVIGWLLLLALAGGGVALFGQGTDDTFSIPGTESAEGLAELERTFPEVSGTSAQIVVVTADGDDIDAAPYRPAIEDAIAAIEEIDDVAATTSPFDEMVSGLVNDEGTAAILRAQFEGEATAVSEDATSAIERVSADLRDALPEGSQVALGGDLFAVEIPGVSVTELVGVGIALLVLLVTFRSFLLAGMPLLTALVGVALSIALIFLATAFATVSSTTPLLALMLGLAVGIDYALFVVARHQDQVRAGVEPEESTARAVGTAGSAVVFAGVTVMIALIGLAFAGIPFLTTMGVAASVAVAIAVAVSLTLTPAILGFAKGRVKGRPPRARRRAAARPAPTRADGTRRTNRWVRAVTRRPVVTTIAVTIGLGIVAVPALDLELALPNAGQLAPGSEARVNYDVTAEEFGPGANGPLIMMGTIITSTDPVALMNDLGDDIATIPGVREVALATPNATADTGIVQIVPETAPDDPATADLVRELRAQHDRLLDEYGVDLKVTGFTAVAIDISDRLGQALIPFAIFVVGLSFVLLMIVFRSIAVPLTAALGYLLSVAAAFGVVAAVFEWGWFADLLHVARVGPVISFMPIVLMGVLFGLAMDYQVFLVTRMREDYVHALRERSGRAPRQTAIGAVRSGFTASARVVTAAALIMFAVFAAFVPEGDSNLKPIALGLAVGVAVDAFLVRMTLIPAILTLLGDKAWWMPRWLDRILPHLDVEGDAVRRELEYAEWPEPGSSAALVADDLGLTVRDRPVFAGVSLRAEPGEAIVIDGADARVRRALLLTLAGRTAPTAGLVRVAGHLLPGRSAWVRAHVWVALLGDDSGTPPLETLRRALPRRGGILLVDGLERLDGPARAEAARVLAGAALRADHPLTIAATSADGPAAETLLRTAGWADIHAVALDDERRRRHDSPTPKTEVPA